MSEDIIRTEIPIGPLLVEGFQLSDGSYRMSQAQAAAAIGEAPVYALRFLRSKDSKLLLSEGYTDYTPESLPVPTAEGSRGESRINALPLEIVSAYWLYRAHRGNKQALVLCMALMTETLERRFDAAFSVSRTETERDQRLSDRLTNQDLEAIGILLAEDDDLRREVAELRRRLAELGADPYALPGDEGGEA